MTKEEVHSRLKENLAVIEFEHPGIGEALKVALEVLSQPSLPSNLDEAAEEWCKTNNKGIALSADKKSHYLAEGMDAFKAGAEWMAGQGETYELTVESPVLGPPMICCSVNANNGDRVIVQIRKKNYGKDTI